MVTAARKARIHAYHEHADSLAAAARPCLQRRPLPHGAGPESSLRVKRTTAWTRGSHRHAAVRCCSCACHATAEPPRCRAGPVVSAAAAVGDSVGAARSRRRLRVLAAGQGCRGGCCRVPPVKLQTIRFAAVAAPADVAGSHRPETSRTNYLEHPSGYRWTQEGLPGRQLPALAKPVLPVAAPETLGAVLRGRWWWLSQCPWGCAQSRPRCAIAQLSCHCRSVQRSWAAVVQAFAP